MSYVDFWVWVDISPDKKKGKWYGMHTKQRPNDEDNSENFCWIQIKETDVIWIINSWDFESGPLPKQYRGLSPNHFTYDFESETWSHDSIESVNWQQIRDARMAKLFDTDWVVVKYTELGQPLPEEWATYRRTLRDFPEIYKNLSAEHAEHILQHTYDPQTKAKRISLGLSVDIPEFIEEE